MKRLLFLLAAALLLLTGCVSQTPVSQSDGSEAASSQGSSVVYEEESNASSSMQNPNEEVYTRAAAERIQAITINDLTTADMLRRLEKMGIDVSVENIKPMDATNLRFDLYFKTATGAALRLPVNAPCGYDTLEDPASFEGEVIGNFDIIWGGISIADSNTIAVSTLQDMWFYDAATLKVQPLKLDFSCFHGMEFFLLGARRDKAAGIVVPVLFDNTEGIAFYNADGSLNRIETFDDTGPSEQWFYTTPNNKKVGYNTVYYQDKLEIVTPDDSYLIFTNTTQSEVNCYNISKKSFFGRAYPDFAAQDGNRRVVLYNFNLWFDNFDDADKNRLALYYENGELRSDFFFDGTDISPSFGKPNIEGYMGLRYQWNPTQPIVSAACSFSDLTITLDFEKSSAKLDYNILPKHLEEAFATSPDSRYSLYESSWDGGGDILLSNIVLKDTQTGSLRFVTLSGGMYGGYEHIGFFTNGDIYDQKLESFRVFSPDPAMPSPLLDFALPLGHLEQEGFTRYLLTFRRDPATKAFIILYTEVPDGVSLFDNADSESAICSYKVGFCDAKGNLLESYDTGKQVLTDFFGLLDMGFQLSGDELTVTGEGGQGHNRYKGVFNLKTHSYKDILFEF